MSALATHAPPKTQFSRMKSVLLVDRIEPCLDFWVDRLGFEVRLQVQGEDHLEFVALCRDNVEILYRTLDSLHDDTPGLVDAGHQPWVVLYLEVDDLDALMPNLDGIEVVVERRETMMGTDEIFVREPSGRILAISQRA
jgi:catechol 2,3-dioxygenase-like lactoylglutathione lyase family enzyme